MKEFARERREELARRSGIPSGGGSVTSRWQERQTAVAEPHQQLVETRALKTSEEKEPQSFWQPSNAAEEAECDWAFGLTSLTSPWGWGEGGLSQQC